MAKIGTRHRAEDEEKLADDYDELDEEYEEEDDEEEEASVVVSDRRARRKRNRGEVIETPSDKKNRPTPSARDKATVVKGSTTPALIRRIPIVRGLYGYFRAAIAEMKKVTWPTREETQHLTRLVLAVTVIFSLGLGLFDVFYGWWFRQALDNDIVFLGVGAVVLLITGASVWFIFGRKDEFLV